MTITVIGTGFVGVVTAAVFASQRHTVYGLDTSDSRITLLQEGKLPFYEPNLTDLVVAGLSSRALTFTTAYQQAVPQSEVVLICVGTPSAESGAVDLQFVESALKAAAPLLKPNTIIGIKSTVPPGSFRQFEHVLNSLTKTSYHLVALPEFLREGSAVSDTLYPDRIIIGTESEEVFKKVSQLYQSLKAPIIKVSPASAQMGKYAANAYLATRITFINQIADLCQENGADIQEVITAMSYDQRIGKHYWYPGLGYGGSCFPKDVKELAYFSRQVGHGQNWFNSMQQFNDQRIDTQLSLLEKSVGPIKHKKIAVLGLAFKPGTDDTRESPAIKVLEWLLKRDNEIRVFDPKASVPEQFATYTQITKSNSIIDACDQADGILLLTEWPEIISFDYSQVRSRQKAQWIFDTRNVLPPAQICTVGYSYMSIGRKVSLSHLI